MRVLVVHNFYRSENASGENLSVRDEIEGLRARGCDVEVLSSDSDVITEGQISLPELAVRPIWSRRSVERARESIRRFRPHVALVENLFPLHSPAVIRTLHSAGVPIAAGVRSYRMWCVQSNMFRDGQECRECLGSRLNLPAVRHGCYQGRAVSSAPMAVGLAVHRGTWQLVDRFLAVSDFVKHELVGFGIPEHRIAIRDNFVADRGRVDEPGTGFLFAGRVGTEKGVEMLLDAWERSEVWRSSRLSIAGSGPSDDVVRAVDPRLNVDALGLVPHQRALELVRESAVVVIPSLWHEPFGRGVVEAASMSRPALVTDRGGLPELVTDGVTGWVSPPDPGSFARALRDAADPAEQVRRGREARQRYDERFTADRSLDVLHRVLDELASR